MRYPFCLFIALFTLPAIADDELPQREAPDMLTRVNRTPGILYPPSDVPVGEQASLYVNLDPVPFPQILRKAKPARIEDPNGSQEE